MALFPICGRYESLWAFCSGFLFSFFSFFAHIFLSPFLYDLWVEL